MAIGHVGAWINLFNLLPVWQLDGAHAFKALSRNERWFVTAIIAGMLIVTHEGLLVLIGIMAAVQAFRSDDFPEGDNTIAWQFASLIIVLAGISTLTSVRR
jgi:Zn-dependent protease